MFDSPSFLQVTKTTINPYMTDGLANHYQLGESTLIFGGIRNEFEFLFYVSMKFL